MSFMLCVRGPALSLRAIYCDILPFSHVFISDINAIPDGQPHEYLFPGANKQR